MADLHDLSARELAAAVRDRRTSSLEVLEHTLERIAALDPALGAFVTLAPELARRQALDAERLVTAARDDPGSLPALVGVPCPVKDLTMVAGVPMSLGSTAMQGFIPPVDDGVVTLLRRAGTVMVGKTSTPELGLPPYTEPDTGPAARSPWDTTRSAGGSSGGAAAAVAAGLVPIAHGSDGGGSIRIPAAACGLVGLKPSRGRISPGPHGVDGPGLGTNGVLTRDVRDTAVALDVLSHPWPGDTYRLAAPPDGFLAACDADPGRLRIGVLTEPIIAPGAPVHPQFLAAVARAGRVLEGMGHHLDTAPVPFPAAEWEPFRDLWSVMAATAPVPPEREALLVPLTRWMRDRGRAVSGVAYAGAVTAGQRLSRMAATAWAAFDVILMPSLAQPSPRIGGMRDDADPAADFEAQMAFTPWTSTWNIIGAPAVSVPLHWAPSDDGVGPVLPFGVTLGARTGREDLLLALAASLERADPWTARRPPVW